MLLIIFMVVTPLLEKDIQVRVPDEDTEVIPEPDPNQIVVSVEESGSIKLNSELVDDASYIERMKRVLAAKPPEERLVFFLPEEKANYARFVFALDGARYRGRENPRLHHRAGDGRRHPGRRRPAGGGPGRGPRTEPPRPAPPAPEPPK